MVIALQEPAEDSRQALSFYDETLKPLLEPAENGRTVAIHVDSGDYEVGDDSSSARFRLRGRQPGGMIVTTDIGPASERVHRWVNHIQSTPVLARPRVK